LEWEHISVFVQERGSAEVQNEEAADAVEEAESEEGAEWQVSQNPWTVSVKVVRICQGHNCSERYVSLNASVDDRRQGSEYCAESGIQHRAIQSITTISTISGKIECVNGQRQ
jgi:hypothetical protein